MGSEMCIRDRAGIVRIAKEDGETFLADMLTKCLPGPRLRELCSGVLW